MLRSTLFKDCLNLVKELKSTIDGGRMFPTGATRCTKNLTVIVNRAMFLHYFVSVTSSWFHTYRVWFLYNK